ncbi:MAG: trypsin-like peptidase domain-containing protein [Desulfacinum sp.]|jgi:putative serine protease PepD|nr:trypsin-like peptidase domain-containing protein [Desulfacinum sp.]
MEGNKTIPGLWRNSKALADNRRLGGLRLGFWVLVLSLFVPGTCRALLQEEKNTIAVYEKVSPSVVNVITTSILYDFFYRPVPQEGAGSGVILKADGTIVTNYHVIRDAKAIEVRLADGSRRPAEVVGTSPEDDLAVIRIEAQGRELVPIELGDSDALQVGQKVYALGNPFGLGHTLTAGGVSQLGRTIRDEGRVLQDLIQVDAAINPGNSGGALVDSRGRLVGINTAILSPTGANVGIGFAIPVNRVKAAVPGMTNWLNRYLGYILAGLLAYWIWRRIARVR